MRPLLALRAGDTHRAGLGRHLRPLRRCARGAGQPLIVTTPHRPLQVWIAGLIVIVDQTTKFLLRSRLDLYQTITVIPGVLNLTRVHNTGAAFGLMNAIDFPFKTIVLALIAAA